MPDIQVKTGYLKDEETNEIFLPRTDSSLVTGLEDLATIRQKSNSAYQKPQTGIPASDLANGVIPSVPVTDVTVGGTSVLNSGTAVIPAIPTVPTISTDISTDAASDQKTASPKAVATYIPTVAPMLAQGMAGIKLWAGTAAEYALLTPSNDTVYFIKP